MPEHYDRIADEMRNEGSVEGTSIEMEFVHGKDSSVTLMNERRCVEIQSVEACEECQYANMTECKMRNKKYNYRIFIHILAFIFVLCRNFLNFPLMFCKEKTYRKERVRKETYTKKKICTSTGILMNMKQKMNKVTFIRVLAQITCVCL